jgi:hypothetical protein
MYLTMSKKLIVTTVLFLTIFFQIAIAAQTFSAKDFVQIKTQAQLANDTYIVTDDMASLLKQQGQTLLHQSTIAGSQVSYFLTKIDDVQTIAIRGTANVENVMLDLDVALQLDTKLNILLHKGFSSGAYAVYQDVKPHLLADKPIHITGHSLGGAISVVLAMYLTQDGYQVPQVITFGQPKVTNVAGSNKFKDLPLIRVVTPQDIVPLVPPLSPLQIKDMDIYWHMGEEVILIEEQQYSLTNGLKSMLRATKFTSSIPSEKNLIAHNMGTYLRLIDQLAESAEEVPYKTEISVFGFSLD